MYSQKESYDLQRLKYKMVEDTIRFGNVHHEHNKVRCTIVHRWKAFRGKDKVYTKNLNWVQIPAELISSREEQHLASNYFQTDDMYYTKTIRFLNKKNQLKAIEYVKSIQK